MSSDSFVAQIMAPGGGILLLPFTRAIVCCLFFTATAVFILGVARIHMFILGSMCLGMYFALGIFQKEYKAFLGADDKQAKNNQQVTQSKNKTRGVSKAKRED
mmetsp:Transcript_8879/g.10283  ORF Transcript_8879/g.10283 Transcript_8879/m.10283 type:complete len:103 (-) Transcript_8879:266-574(-)